MDWVTSSPPKSKGFRRRKQQQPSLQLLPLSSSPQRVSDFPFYNAQSPLEYDEEEKKDETVEYYDGIDFPVLAYNVNPKRNIGNIMNRRHKGAVQLLIVIVVIIICASFYVLFLPPISKTEVRHYLKTKLIPPPVIMNEEFYNMQQSQHHFLIDKGDWDWSLIHIVQTRFMQHQSKLSYLGWARWYAFLSFCYPTMIKQSNQNFLWIIQTDPELWYDQPQLFQDMQQQLSKHSNIFLVGNNELFFVATNDTQSPSKSWKEGSQGADLLYHSPIYTGNITLLHQAMMLRNDLVVLETRLDADDGLDTEFIATVQQAAEEKLIDSDSKKQWLYWCSRRHIEWHVALNNTNTTYGPGVIFPIQHTKLCVTPGITVGYRQDVDPQIVPIYPHDQLYNRLRHRKTIDSVCTDPPCLEFIDNLPFSAIRSRTITSAGMSKINDYIKIFKNDTKQAQFETYLWDLFQERFAVEFAMIDKAQNYLNQYQAKIAHDNYIGQCTMGHSCKDAARQELQGYFGNNTDDTIGMQPQQQ